MVVRRRSCSSFIALFSWLYAQMFKWSCIMAHCAALSSISLMLVLCMPGTSSHQALCGGADESSLSYDVTEYTCCSGKIIKGSYLTCCGATAYNPLESSCCMNEITIGLSQVVSQCCKSKAYNPLNQICCDGHLKTKNIAQTACCGSAHFDTEKELCCGNRKVVNKTTENHVCCGEKSYNKLTQDCTDNLEVLSLETQKTAMNSRLPETSQPSALHTQQNISPSGCRDGRMSPHASDYHERPSCGTQKYDPNSEICCSGIVMKRVSSYTQCCGKESYQLTEDGVLCCDGTLHRNQPAGSMCSGKVAFSPHLYTVCQQKAHLPAGQQCCGKKTFDPSKEICCDGHKHPKSKNMVCCGSYPYIPGAGTHKCCSGHLHDLKNKIEAQCCGPLLLKEDQHCCHSAEKSLAYKSQPGHSCCSHWYYNTSLWSCCTGRLNHKPTNASLAEVKAVKVIRPLLDHSISAICNESVLLGTVESVAVKHNKRFVALKYMLIVNTNVTLCRRCPPEVGPLDHCLFPALEPGRTYLWTNKYEPLADVTGLTSPVHTILSLCHSKHT